MYNIQTNKTTIAH